MELHDLQQMWNDHDKKLDKTLRLNMELLRKINFDKARFRIRSLFIIKLVEMVLMMFTFNYLLSFIIKYFTSPQFSLPALIIEAAIILYFITDIRMLATIHHLQLKNNDEAIAPLQKSAATLKLLIARAKGYALFLIPCYPVLMIVIGKIFLNIDFTNAALKGYFISNVVAGALLLPFFIWIFRELNQKEITKNWVKKLLPGSGWYLVNDAVSFLNEIERFEGEN